MADHQNGGRVRSDVRTSSKRHQLPGARFIYQLPKAHPWLGQFPISTRLGLGSHLAALFGGAAIRQQLFTDPTVPYALLAGGLKSLVPSDAKQFNQKMASWPGEHKSLVFGPNYTH